MGRWCRIKRVKRGVDRAGRVLIGALGGQGQGLSLRGGGVLDDPPVAEPDDPVGDVEVFVVVADDDQGFAGGPEVGQDLVVEESA